MSRQFRVGFVIVFTGLVGVLYLSSAQAQPKPVEITTEWMEENTQVQYKDLLKASRTTAAAFKNGAGATAQSADKMAGLAKIISVSKPPNPPKDLKDPEAVWKNYAEDLNKSAAEAAKAARANNPAAYRAAFKRIDDACVKCHEVFKP